MKKKILTILLTVFMIMTTFTINVAADDTATLTIDLNGGSLSNGLPDGWIDIGDGKYSKDYPINESVNLAEEWSNYEPIKTNCEFDSWKDDNWSYWDGFRITSDITVKAIYKAYLYVIMNLNGGTISNESVPSEWEKVPDHDDQYRKIFLEGTYYWTVTEEWNGIIPQYGDASDVGFAGWENPEWFDLLEDNSVINAKTDSLLNVILDLKGGTFSDENVPSGWTKDAAQDDKYIKKYVKGTSSWDIKNELENVTPQYSEVSGIGFVGWKDPEWNNLEDDNSNIEAKTAGLKIVTVDLDGGTALSVDSSWTQDLDETDKYTKKFPVGYYIYKIEEEIRSCFSIKYFDGNKYFTSTYNRDLSLIYVPDNDDTLFTALYENAIKITFEIPSNASVIMDDEIKNSTFTLDVPANSKASNYNGKLRFSSSSPNVDYYIEVYGNPGYEVEYFTYKLTKIDSTISTLADGDVFSASTKEGSQKYPIWIDGTQLSDGNTTILDGTVSYDPSTRTLTLDGADIVFSSSSGISFDTNITINVVSDSSITAVESGISKYAIAGMSPSNFSFTPVNSSNLNITGNGKLTIDLKKTEAYIGTVAYVGGIVANKIIISTDVDIISDKVHNNGSNDVYFYGINSTLGEGITIKNGKSVKVNVASISSNWNWSQCQLIGGPLTIDENANVDLVIGRFTSDNNLGYPRYVNLISGSISISSNPTGSIYLSKPASLMTIEGAKAGAKTTDTSFTQANSSTPLLLSTKGLVVVDGVSMAKTEFKSNETVEYSGSPTVKKKVDSTDVTDQIDNWNYTYYKESEEGSGIWNKLSSTPTDEGSYKLVVEVVDSEYFGKLELPFTVIHAHNFSYTVNSEDASQIIATCSGADCEYKTTPLTLTLTAPSLENLVYNESAKEIDFADGEADAWKTVTGNDAPTIEYYLEDGITKTNNSNSKSSGEGLAPVNAGTYKAKTSVDEKTAIISFTISPKTYEIIEGNEIEWRKGDNIDLVITSKAPYSEFKCVNVDNNTIDTANYTVVEGSTKVTIDSNYLETLSIGSYSFEIASTNGIARATVKIVSKVTPSPGTKYIVPNTRAR